MLLSQKHKLIDPSCLEEKVKELKAENQTIATLNGSFDLMHAGHLEMIYQASMQADVLIVALNTDRSIQQYKGPLRPIIPLKFRQQMMAALEMVDYVTWFDEIDPRQILAKIKPDVHVNGAEYGENCIEAELIRAHGGRIHIVSLVPGLSTSQIIRKIVCHAQEGFVNLDPARQSQIDPEGGAPLPVGKGDEEGRFGEVAAGPNSQNLTERGIKTCG